MGRRPSRGDQAEGHFAVNTTQGATQCDVCTQIESRNVQCFEDSFDASSTACSQCSKLSCVRCGDAGIEVLPNWQLLNGSDGSERQPGLHGLAGVAAIFRCPYQAACLRTRTRGAACAKGYSNPLCAVCARNHYRSGQKCHECGPQDMWPAYAMLLLAVAVVLATLARWLYAGWRAYKASDAAEHFGVRDEDRERRLKGKKFLWVAYARNVQVPMKVAIGCFQVSRKRNMHFTRRTPCTYDARTWL